MCSAPYILTHQDSDDEAAPALFRVQTPAGERFDTIQVERVSVRDKTE